MNTITCHVDLNNDKPHTLELLHVVRAALHEKWVNHPVQKQPSTASEGQCIRTAVVLQTLLGGEIKAGWNQENGRTVNAGFFDGKEWHFHYWLCKENVIIDLSADQFGAPNIILSMTRQDASSKTALIGTSYLYRPLKRPQNIHQDTQHKYLHALPWATELYQLHHQLISASKTEWQT